MPKALLPRRASRDDVTASIFDAAIQLFAIRGYEATTMQDVAAKVGMTAPALYYYFDSKQRLLFEVIERNLIRFNENFAAAVASPRCPGSPRAQLGAFVRTHLEFQLEKVDRARVYNAMFLGTHALLDALTTPQRAKIVRLQTWSLDRLRAILEAGATRGEFGFTDVTITALGIIAIGEFAAGWFKPGGRLSAPEIADHYQSLVLKMVAP